MPVNVARVQETQVGHRMNTVGRPSGPNAVSWDYETTLWTIERPADGDEPLRRKVRCGTCEQSLAIVVYSVADTRRRQARFRGWTWFCALLLLAGLAGIIYFGVTASMSSAPGLTSLASVFVTFPALWVVGLRTEAEAGITHRGSSGVSVAKHVVTPIEPPPASPFGTA
ncbi:hypothetical protein [Streptomyces uncialis]|uniref:hypothetical protein n=1 Tax=Streptomyces uncialis TaxID=1048205 RepID=UPI00225950A6|nr:hypothetical protein [Streptomyces uncialis]MCX4658182.1 hypothetical protein [Streptomyces uncialis]